MRRYRSALPILLLLVTVGATAIFVEAQWRSAAQSRALIDHSHALIEASTTLVKEMVDAETGQRGYLLTEDDAYLAPLTAAEISVPERFSRLAALSRDNPSHLARIGVIQGLWADRLGIMRQSVGSAAAGDFAGAILRVRTGRGRELMDRIRGEVDQFQSEERTLLTERLADADRTGRDLGFAIAAILALATLGMALSILALLRKAATLARDVQSQRLRARSLEEAAFDLAGEVSSVKAELSDTAVRFDAALRTAPIAISSQDRDLRYLWMRNSLLGQPADWFIGRTDAEVMPEPARSRMVTNKEEALQTGEPRDFEIHLPGGADPDGSWYDVHVEPTRDERGTIDGVTAVAMEVSERKRRERHVRLLMRELAHRSKNILAVTQAMARQTAANTGSVEEFLDRFAERLDALGRAHTLLLNEGWAGAGIDDLVRAQLGHYADLIGRQVFIDGPPLTLPTEMVQTIGLALHELATNAAKYGSLSTPDGRVDIAWTLDPHEDGSVAVKLGWTESGGPPVVPPTRRGFGRVVIERTVARAVGGEVTLDYRPEGLVWRLAFDRPAESAAEAPAHSAATA